LTPSFYHEGREPRFHIFIPTVAAHMRREVEESLIFTCEKGISRLVTPAAFLARNDNLSPVFPKIDSLESGNPGLRRTGFRIKCGMTIEPNHG